MWLTPPSHVSIPTGSPNSTSPQHLGDIAITREPTTIMNKMMLPAHGSYISLAIRIPSGFVDLPTKVISFTLCKLV